MSLILDKVSILDLFYNIFTCQLSCMEPLN